MNELKEHTMIINNKLVKCEDIISISNINYLDSPHDGLTFKVKTANSDIGLNVYFDSWIQYFTKYFNYKYNGHNGVGMWHADKFGNKRLCLWFHNCSAEHKAKYNEYRKPFEDKLKTARDTIVNKWKEYQESVNNCLVVTFDNK